MGREGASGSSPVALAPCLICHTAGHAVMCAALSRGSMKKSTWSVCSRTDSTVSHSHEVIDDAWARKLAPGLTPARWSPFDRQESDAAARAAFLGTSDRPALGRRKAARLAGGGTAGDARRIQARRQFATIGERLFGGLACDGRRPGLSRRIPSTPRPTSAPSTRLGWGTDPRTGIGRRRPIRWDWHLLSSWSRVRRDAHGGRCPFRKRVEKPDSRQPSGELRRPYLVGLPPRIDRPTPGTEVESQAVVYD
jgi:hypothetical protein